MVILQIFRTARSSKHLVSITQTIFLPFYKYFRNEFHLKITNLIHFIVLLAQMEIQ